MLLNTISRRTFSFSKECIWGRGDGSLLLRQSSILSLLASKFPEVWKTAEITPIPKQGNHELPNNNRPISLLPALSKVCERVAYNQFVTYLTTKERLTTKQSGNKKWFSTETSLIHTTDAFLKGIDDKKLTACVLLDMSKAFDSVDHQILLRKIQSVGASTSALKWFNSYLTKFEIAITGTIIENPSFYSDIHRFGWPSYTLVVVINVWLCCLTG